MNKTGITLIALASAAIVLAGCGTGPSQESPTSPQEVTLSFQWWGNDDRAVATEEVVDLYESTHPGITIETSYAPDTNYWDKMATEVAAGNTPDIFQMKLENFGDYQSRGTIADLTSYTTGGDAVIPITDFGEQYLAAGLIGEQVFGLPTGQSTQAIFYDQDAWASYGLAAPELGWTWDDLIAAGETVKAATGGEKAILSDFGSRTSWFENWLVQRDKSLYTPDGDLNFSQADLEEFWGFTTSLVEQGIVTPAEITTANDYTMANSGLIKGASLAEFNDVSLANAYFSTYTGQIGLAPIPADADAAHMGGFAGVTQLLVMSSTTEHPDEAADFLNFFLNDPEAGAILGLVRGMPANEAILGSIVDTLEAGDQATYAFEEEMGEATVARPPVAPAGGAESMTDFTTFYDQVIFGQLTVAEAAEQTYAQFESNIA